MIYYKDFFRSCDLATFDRVEGPRGVTYINIDISFDIETSTTFNAEGEPLAFMYIWQMGINGKAINGRTWGEFKDCLNELSAALNKQQGETAVIFVHNLAFEFAFNAPYLHLDKVFARTPHHPIYFTTKEGFEFRCSYFLTGKSLAKVAESTTVKKLVGDLDYSKIRTWKTPLTPEEMAYCENDVLILNEYIRKEMERCGDIGKIPYTKTGYVRREVLESFQQWEHWDEYRTRLKRTFPDLKQFSILNKAFAGGFTHANCAHVGLTLAGVGSYDIASSYPAQMIKHKFPLALRELGEIGDREIFFKLVKKYGCVFEITITGVKAKSSHHTISRHKCSFIDGEQIDNGRVVKAAILTTFMTSPDWLIFDKFYTYDKIMVHNFYYGDYEYLPTPLVENIVKRYKQKCTLKHGDPVEYMAAKEFINSLYGMTVQNPLEDTIIYDGGNWSVEREPEEKQLKKKQYSSKYCLPYVVGVFVTAWARYELLSTVYLIGSDAVYCDTDSIKLLEPEKHKDIFELYNTINNLQIEEALKHHGIAYSEIPSDKPIGVFEYEGKYDEFKTLGAKRYCYTQEGEFSYTVAGLPKSRGGEFTPLGYMQEQAAKQGKTLFELFDFDFTIPKEYTCKLGTVYNVTPWRAFVTDYLGQTAEVGEMFGVALEPLPFTMMIAGEFFNFLQGLENSPQMKIFRAGDKRECLKITPLD